MDLITADFSDNRLVLLPHGRIDTTTAPEAEKLIWGFCGQYVADDVVIDAGGLEYISSVGLRIILRLKKEKPGLKIVNVSSEVYEIFDMTGFSEIISIEKAYRQMSVDGCRIIGKGAKGTVYRYDADTVVKVYKDVDSLPAIQNERELARKAFVLGIPTAISYDVVKVGELFGSVFELLDAKSYSQLICDDPGNIDRYVGDFAALLRLIHSTTVRPQDMPDGKKLIYKWLGEIKPYLCDEDNEKLLNMVNALPDTLNMLHGDYHTNNLMMQNGETLLIDMDTLSHGHPILELANVFATYVGFYELDSENVIQFMGFPAESINAVWGKFLPAYLDTDDAERINSVDAKARLLGYVRTLRHAIRHSTNPEYGAELCLPKIHELLKTVDTFDF